MKFKTSNPEEEPEINLIPMIDILLVVLIFLLVTSTLVKPSALKVHLPNAEYSEGSAKTEAIAIRVTKQGQYALDGHSSTLSATELKTHLLEKIQHNKQAKEKISVLVEADANASHQAVVHALDAISQAGLVKVGIVTQKQ